MSKRLQHYSSGDDEVEEGFVHKRSRRNDMRNLDAYNSDSEPEADGYSTDEEAGKTGPEPTSEKVEELRSDDDMFASEEENKADAVSSGLSKPSGFDIETFNKENEIVPDTEPVRQENEVQIESFNLDDDMKHGTFDKDGNFTRRQDDDEDAVLIEDKWMDENTDTKRAAESHKKQQQTEKQRLRQMKKNMRHYMIDEALLRLFYFVGKTASVVEVLGRLNGLRTKSKDKVEKEYITNAIDFVTDLIDILEQKGVDDVYNIDKNKLSALIEEESLGTTSLIDPGRKIWSFKWMKDLNKIHEPYSSHEMSSWKKTYFKNKAIVKFKDDEDVPTNWIHISCLEFL